MIGGSLTEADDKPTRGWRHAAGFGFSGLLAFGVDAGLLYALTEWGGLSPFLARIPSIGLAMLAGWLSNRTLTFAVRDRPHLREFLRYATASGLGIATNYTIFSATLLARPATAPVVALTIASIIAMGVSYAGYRWFAFARR